MNFIDHELFDDIKPHIRDRFVIYHRENPHVFELFLKYARQAKSVGYKKYAARTIQERIRWHMSVETKNDPFKINDHYHACYARLLIINYPDEFTDFFELRSPQKRKEIYKELNYHGETQNET